MKNSFYIVVLVLLVSFASVEKTQVSISEQSEITISGKSNVNSFQCNYNQDLIKSELTVTHSQKESKIFLNGAVFFLKSKGFDCAHRIITKDLKEVLKADDYPNIKIEVNEISIENGKTIAKSTITIAGVKKTYNIPVKVNQKTNNVNGILTLDIKDFKLKSPKKILGLIKLNDVVSIEFDLYLKY